LEYLQPQVPAQVLFEKYTGTFIALTGLILFPPQPGPTQSL